MKKILSIIFAPLTVFRLLAVFIFSFFFAKLAIVESKFSDDKKIPYTFLALRWWGKTMLFILGIYVKRDKVRLQAPYIVMSNHRSYADIFIIAAYAPASFVAKAELKKWPLIGRYAAATKLIMVKRDEMRSLIETMKKIKNNIENNTSVAVFPEGTTFKGPGTKAFKNGTFKIASELANGITPCALAYRNKNIAWVSTDTFIGHFFREMWRPLSIAELRFAEPITGTDYLVLKDKTRQSIDNLLIEMEN